MSLIDRYFSGKPAMENLRRVREVQEKINERPRKCLGWRTSREVISDQAAIVSLPG